MAGSERLDSQGAAEPQDESCALPKPVRNQDLPMIGHRDEAAVERRIQMRSQQESIEHVEPLGVAGAGSPRLDVARAQEPGHIETGHRAAAFPIVEQPGAEDVLPHALDHEALGLGRPRQCGGPPFEGVEQLVGERLRELEGPAHEPVELRNARDPSGSDRSHRKERAGRDSQVERGGDIALGQSGEEQRLSRCRQPDSQGALRARERKPFAFARQLTVEAIVDGQLLQQRERGGGWANGHRRLTWPSQVAPAIKNRPEIADYSPRLRRFAAELAIVRDRPADRLLS